MGHSQQKQSIFHRLAILLLVVPFVVLGLPFLLSLLVVWVVYGILLTVAVWLTWCPRGIDALVVFSDSPHWKEHMIDVVIPRVEGRSIILNWSERKQWKQYALAVAVFRYFGGERDFNPMVVVLRPLRLPRTFRFRQAFLDRRHGKADALSDVEDQLNSYLGL